MTNETERLRERKMEESRKRSVGKRVEPVLRKSIRSSGQKDASCKDGQQRGVEMGGMKKKLCVLGGFTVGVMHL